LIRHFLFFIKTLPTTFKIGTLRFNSTEVPDAFSLILLSGFKHLDRGAARKNTLAPLVITQSKQA